MKKGAAKFFKAIIVLIGIGALAFMLWEPHLEGRNAHATIFEIYFKDPFLAYAYLGSIPFFIALHQAFKVLGYAGQGKAFSPPTVKALRAIRYCALALIGFVAFGMLLIVLGDSDDHGGPVALGGLVMFGSAVVAASAARLERAVRNAAD